MSEDPCNPVVLRPSNSDLTSQSSDFDASEYRRERATTIARIYRALSLALTVARPASYGDAACKAWLEAAFEFVADLPVDVLEIAAREAGKVCRHPAQIVPTIHEQAAEIIAARDRQRRLAAPVQLAEGWGAEPLPPKLHLSREECDRIKEAAAAMAEQERRERLQRRGGAA
ncbi:hypothetical protein [Novosphingobium sp.]|uniref:hypothetical protein n=1 Tax=Novosphingobium sp. TaxID=1874826 RepID=UPI002634D783|nr:hypothetical protein [Novosphingobium sp.]